MNIASYVPKIEEFYQGFEYLQYVDPRYNKEYGVGKDPDTWITKVCDIYDLVNFNNPKSTSRFEKLLELKQVKVLYLSHVDINSLGWKLVKDNIYNYPGAVKLPFGEFTQPCDVELHYNYDTKRMHIIGSLGDEASVYFNGIIKNKSEFKKLIKSLDII